MFISPVLMTLLNGMTGSMQDSLLLFALLTLAIAGATGIASARMGPPRAGSLISPDDIIITRPPVFRRKGRPLFRKSVHLYLALTFSLINPC